MLVVSLWVQRRLVKVVVLAVLVLVRLPLALGFAQSPPALGFAQSHFVVVLVVSLWVEASFAFF
jgi:hypothetical protein